MDKKDFKVDFMGIGAQKGGTTWIAKCLSEHPDICMSEPKEILYFNKFSSFSNKCPINNYHKKTFSWYRKHFLHCKKGQINGEFSAEYFYDKEAPRLIRKYFPDIKLIVLLDYRNNIKPNLNI